MFVTAWFDAIYASSIIPEEKAKKEPQFPANHTTKTVELSIADDALRHGSGMNTETYAMW